MSRGRRQVARRDGLLERLDGAEELHAEAFAAAVVLRDERRRKVLRGLQQRLGASSHGPRGGRAEAGLLQRGVLLHLADLQLEGVQPVDDAAVVALQPGEELVRVLDARCVAARVRRRAHPVQEDPFGRRLRHVEVALVNQPLLVRDLRGVERLAQWGHPVLVFVDDVGVHGDRGGIHRKAPRPGRPRG